MSPEGCPVLQTKNPLNPKGWRLHLLSLYQRSDPAKCPAHQCQDSFLRGFGFTGPSAPRVHLQSYEKGYAAMPDRHRQPRTSLERWGKDMQVEEGRDLFLDSVPSTERSPRGARNVIIPSPNPPHPPILVTGERQRLRVYIYTYIYFVYIYIYIIVVNCSSSNVMSYFG